MPSSACDWSSDVCSSDRSEEHTSELQSRSDLVCRLLLEKKKNTRDIHLSPPENPCASQQPTDTASRPIRGHTHGAPPEPLCPHCQSPEARHVVKYPHILF